jgi:large conductance mechanosensitive channel
LEISYHNLLSGKEIYMKKLFKEFREFVSKGNMIDLAVGIIVGSAFSSVVNSIINNLLMPPLGLLFGDVDFTDLFIVLKGGDGLPANPTLEMAKEAGAVTFNYGQFITDLLSFLILALAVFLIIKAVQSIKKEEKAVEEQPTEKTCPFCQEKIPLNATRCPFCTSHLDKE